MLAIHERDPSKANLQVGQDDYLSYLPEPANTVRPISHRVDQLKSWCVVGNLPDFYTEVFR